MGAYIRQLQEWERLDTGSFQLLRAERLAQALEYARTRVPMYRSRAWNAALQRRDAHILRSWPVLERQTIQSHEAAMVAQPAPRGTYFRSTSGSTGTPLRVGMDPAAAAWAWAADYRATRPKVERKLGHLMRRRHGGRRARVRGKRKVDADFNLLAAAHNLARLTALGLRSTTTGWAAVSA